MKKLLSAVLVLVLCGFAAATDVRVQGASVYGVLARGSAWSNYASAGLTYVFDAVSPSSGVCVTMVNNNPTNTRTVTLSAAITADQGVTTFASNQGNWSSVPVSPPQSSYIVPVFSTSATGTFQIFLRAVAASHIAFTISGQTGTAGGSPDTVTILYSWSGSSCGGVNQWAVGGSTTAGAALSTVEAAVVGIRHVVNCVSVSNAGTATAGANITFTIRDGGAAGPVLWIAAVGVGTLANASTSINSTNISLCGLNISSSAGNSLNLISSGGIAGQILAGSMSGYDQ
jgi:hypothetical protein